ncbi:MAG: heme-binding protein [Gammaproteobacteria bacterium]
MSIEEPAYTVRDTSGKIEYREYAPYLKAETLVEGAADFESAGNEGFRRLFRYITGGNTTQSKIAMTAPVSQTGESEKIAMTVPVQQTGSAGGWLIAFTLPKQYTLETAPVPGDSRVRIVSQPARLFAVLRYSGRWTESNYNESRDELLGILAAAGVAVRGEPQLARYNAPFIPPFMRRNEVMIEVDSLPLR